MSFFDFFVDGVKFVYWVLNVSGGFVVSMIEQCIDWSFEYNQIFVCMVEVVGFDYVLSQICFMVGYGVEYQYELVLFSQVLLYVMMKFKVFVVILLGLWYLVVVVKQFVMIDYILNGCIVINVVSGWFKGEFIVIGELWFEYDECYWCLKEFIQVFKGIWIQDNFMFKGDFYCFNDYMLSLKLVQKLYLEIFQGGSLCVVCDNVVSVFDWYFMNGNMLENLKVQIDDICVKVVVNNYCVWIGVNVFVIVCDIEEEVQVVFDDIIWYVYVEVVYVFGDVVKQVGKVLFEGEGNWVKLMFEDLVQYNDGFCMNLIGMLQQIVEWIVVLKVIGVDFVLVGFLYFIEEVEYFGKCVLLFVCELEVQWQVIVV